MQVWLRLLIVWLIGLALPVQGMAGVTLVHCGPGHERMATALMAEHDHPSAHEAAAAHRHDAAMVEAADAVDRVATPSGAQQGKFTKLAKYKCSSCASCCAGAALPSVMPRVPELASAPAVFAEAGVTVDAFASEGPDRPPRT